MSLPMFCGWYMEPYHPISTSVVMFHHVKRRLCPALGTALGMTRLNNSLGRLVTASVVSRTWYGAGLGQTFEPPHTS